MPLALGGDARNVLLAGKVRRVAEVAAVLPDRDLRVPVEADGIADAEGDLFGAGAVEIYAAQLAVGVVVQHVVGGWPTSK